MIPAASSCVVPFLCPGTALTSDPPPPPPHRAPRRWSVTKSFPPVTPQVPKLGWLQILTFIMFMEVIGILNSRRPDYEPGNFLGTSQWEMDATWDSYQTKELNNGRLAMFASIGMLTHAYITGKGPLELLDAGGGGVVF